MNEAQHPIETTWADLQAIVGRDYIWPASLGETIDGLQPAKVIAPANAQQVAEVLRYCSTAGLAIIPRGGGTKLGWGNRPQKADLVLSTERLNKVIEHAWGDMTTTVEAGCTIADLQRTLQEHGQRLAADPLYPETATVGGFLATADNGTFALRYGGVRDLVLGVEIALPDGTLVKAGGKVVKNVAGYDLCKLMIGSLGTLGVITRAVFRLHPLAVATATYTTLSSSAKEAAKLLLAILDSQLVYTGLQIRADHADQITIDIRFEGIPESLEDQYFKLARVSGGVPFVQCAGAVWNSREKMFSEATDSVICKVSVLPSQIGWLCESVFQQAEATATATFAVAQATGTVQVRLDAPTPAFLLEALAGVRGEVERLDGSLLVQQCPQLLKEELDVWGALKDGFALMQQIKGKYDPARTLNPGRFVGAI